MEQLAAHLRRLASEPFEYGRCDCLLALADWVLIRTGVDLGAEFRGRYRTDREWMRIVIGAGGMRVLMGELLYRVGWCEVEDARPGDIAVVMLDPDVGPHGALRGEQLWYLKMLRGLSAAQNPLIVCMWGPR